MLIALNSWIKKYHSILVRHIQIPTFMYLRKSRLFIKSRYSRNRQWSKSIVYFGLWFNIISVIGGMFYCYRYIFIFSYFYIIGFIFVLIVALRVSKYNSLDSIILWLKSLTFKV